mgnify:CR=1 FL=1
MKKTIKDYELEGKRVIIRVDFNVPIKEGIIKDDNRIIESLETINYAISHKAKVILLSHLGRVKEEADKINDKRLAIWNFYHENLEELEKQGVIERPFIPDYATHNAHMYYLKVKDLETRTSFIKFMKVFIRVLQKKREKERERALWLLLLYVFPPPEDS